MPMPLSQDYNEAIQNPQSSFSDPELKQGQAVTNALGLPVPCSGNFADVYALQTPRQKWAVKCFTREIPGIRERYQQVSAYLHQQQLPFMVDFKFLDQGIKVRGQWYPVLKMHWVEGFTLNQFVRDQLHNPPLIQTLCQIWVKLAARLKEANMAHCDLQHGNVMLVPSKQGSLGVRLVDYDGMFVPALEFLKTIEVGHPNFQHPLRIKQGYYGVEVDRFSHLVIYTALKALQTSGKPLWNKFENGDNLLFRQQDLAAPGSSPVFAELGQHKDPEVRRLTNILAAAVTKPINQTPALSDLVSDTPTTKVAVPGPQRTTRVRKESSGSFSLVAVAGVLAVVAALGVGGFFLLGGSADPTQPSVASAPASLPSNPVAPVSTEKDKPPVSPEKDKPPVKLPITKADVVVPPVKSKDEAPPKTGSTVEPEPAVPVKVIPGTGEPLIRTIEVGDRPIRHLAISSDGRRAVSYGPPTGFCIWNLENGSMKKLATPNSAILQSAAFLSNNDALLQWDGRVDVIDVNTLGSKEFDSLRGNATFVAAPAAGGWFLVLGAQARQLEAPSAKLMGASSIQNPPITRCSLTPDGTHALMLCGQAVKYCKLAEGLLLQPVAATQRGVIDVLISPNGQTALLLTASNVTCWNLATNTRISLIVVPKNPITSAAFTPDGNHAIVGLQDGEIRITALKTPAVITATLNGHTQAVRSLKLLDGNTLLSSSDDRTMRMWKLPSNVTPPPPAVVVKLPDPPPVTKPPQPKPEPKPEPKVIPRLPVPNDKDKVVQDTTKAVREVYGLDKLKAAEKGPVAFKMVQKAQETEDPIERYVILREARDLAIPVGAVETVIQAIDKLDERFIIDPLDMKASALTKLQATTPPDAKKSLAEQCLETADQAVDVDRYDLAISLIKSAEYASRSTETQALNTQAKSQLKQIQEAEKEYEKIKPLLQTLKDQPDDPAINLTVGRFLCFGKGDFDSGLPLLVKGSDVALQALAKKDLAQPTAAAAQVEVGDGWYDLAKAETAATKKLNMQKRMAHWYQQAQQAKPGLPAGITKDLVDKRLKEIIPLLKPTAAADKVWLVIFRSINPTRWNTNTNVNQKNGNDYAISFDKVPAGVRYLRLTQVASKEFVIIPMTKANLTAQTTIGKYGFEGTLLRDSGGVHLGIWSTELQPAEPREVAIREFAALGFPPWYRGWGFGHFFLFNNGQAYSWNGQTLQPCIFEFAVKTGDLTDAESKRLLAAPAAAGAAP